MKRFVINLFLLLIAPLSVIAQTSAPTSPAPAANQDVSVPNVVKFSSRIRELDGSVKSGLRGLRFAIYRTENDLSPVWTETHSLAVDGNGSYSVLLGLSGSVALSPDIFESGEPRWIGVTPEDGVERTRVLLTTVPYAFKAADADQLGGRSASDFVTQEQLRAAVFSYLPIGSPEARHRIVPLPWPGPGGGGGAGMTLPFFEATGSAGPSFISDATTGPPFQLASSALNLNLNADMLHGLTDSAFAKLQDANSFSALQTMSGGSYYPASVAEANNPSVFDSSSLDLESADPDSQSGAKILRLFRWNAKSILGQPNGPYSRLALSFGNNGATPAETGLSINSDGTINFAPGQQLPTAAVIAALNGDPSGTQGGSGGTSSAPVVDSTNYSWSQTETTPTMPVNVGSNEITLSPCPKGVNGTDKWHYMYISGSGTPEVVLITGGTCKSGAQTGTLQFSSSYTHPAPYTLASATDGVQEAIIDATGSGSNISRKVMIDPGSHLFRARLSIRASNITVGSSGATITCAVSDTCIMMGDPDDANLFSDIVLSGLRLSPGIPAGTWTAIEDNAGGSKSADIGTSQPQIPLNSFGSLIQVDNDQAATIDRLNTNLSQWSRCDTSFCSTAIVGPGPFSKNAGVIWVTNSNLALQCKANGIDNQNANTLNISNSVIEAYAQFGVRARSTYAPNTVLMNGDYMEVGNCQNPLGTGEGGLIVEGGRASTSGMVGPQGQLPIYSNTGNTRYYYYVVVNSSQYGVSIPYLAGYANSDGTTPVKVVWNQVGKAGTISYDVLRIAGDGGIDMKAPSGTGLYAIAVGLLASTNCSNMACSTIDNISSPAFTYTALTSSNYAPSLWNWPAGVVLTTAFDTQNTGGATPTKYFTDAIGSGVSIVSAFGALAPSVFSQECDPMSQWSSIWMQCTGGNAESNDNPMVTGTVLQLTSLNGQGGYKGRLIFEAPKGSDIRASHVITLLDSNPDKTMASPNNRPTWDAADTFIGFDAPGDLLATGVQLAFGAPVAISNYIGNVGDNVRWGERLTAKMKSFQVPVQLPVLFSGTDSNTDMEGIITLTGTISGVQSFSGKYASAPNCVVTPLSDPTLIGSYWENFSTTSLTVYVKNAGTISFSYHCDFRRLASSN